MNVDTLKFYSDKGWPIFPVKPHDKTPMVKWADEATTDMGKISGWLSHYAEMNVGLVTGETSDMFVLDVDAGHGGFESLAELQAKYGPLPKTPMAHTGGGGRHYFFKHPHRPIRNVQNSGKLGKGLDIRADGGYVVAAPSVHSSGNEYKWDRELAPSKTPLAEAPAWLIEMLVSEQTASAPAVNVDENSAITLGGRNNTLISLAGSMRRRGMGFESIYTALLAENKAKCVPPLTDAEVKKIAQSISNYQPSVEFEQRDRVQAEWAFVKSLYDYPFNATDFWHVPADVFSVPALKEWWSGYLAGEDMGELTVKHGLLADLESFKDYDPFRVDAYASAITRFGHLAKVERYADALKAAARRGSDPQIDRTINEINKNITSTTRSIEVLVDVANAVEQEIRERAQNPTDVWGIPYAWNRLSVHTGGKQKGEMILCSAEPKLGKSWWWLQDSLFTALDHDVPVFYWCGEMRKSQLMKRFYQLLGVNARAMKTGQMKPSDWESLEIAKERIITSPLFIDDQPLNLYDLRPLLARQKQEHGIQQFVIDYAMKIIAPGKDEVEQTSNISKEIKAICLDLELSGVLITSVNKMGMDNKSEGVLKGNIRGSGQQIHDADIIYIMSSFPEKYGIDYGLKPTEYEKVIALWIAAGRELDHQLEGGFIPYMRDTLAPNFRELERGK